ncbi:unnamed protein product [Rotaria magnacalcarata]
MSRRRLALIFGNDNYGGDKQLTSCVKDARDMESKLRSDSLVHSPIIQINGRWILILEIFVPKLRITIAY